MGANLSLLAPNAHTVAIRSYVDVLPNFKFLEVVNNTRFLKTIKAYDVSTGTLVVIKVFIKPPQTSIWLQNVTEALIKEASLIAPYANLLMWGKIIETDSAGYLVRQMVKTNLYDRISLRPFLAPIEKRWLVFQMLKIMELLHDHLHICHGDLKTENFLVTSSNWLVLTDFAQHTKPVYLPDDNPSEFVFYFDSSNRRVCYVAPERFHSKSQIDQLDLYNTTLSPDADLFSLGCVIAELYMDGEPPFTLSDLYRYKKGDSEPNIAGISEIEVQRMTKDLLSLDPNSRSSASEILDSYRGSFFPVSFYDFLYDFMNHLNTPDNFVVDKTDDNRSPSDLRIEKIHSSFDKIGEALGLVYSDASCQNKDISFPYLRLNLKGMPGNYTINSTASLRMSSQSGSDLSAQGALIVLDAIFSLVKTIKRPSNKLKACELILALSEHIGDEAKLDRSLPYLCIFLDEFIDKAPHDLGAVPSDPSFFPKTPEFSSKVASVSLIAMTNLLESCSSINPINAHVFPDFIYPKLKSLAFLNCFLKEELNHVKSTLSSCLPYLTKISERFMVFASGLSNGTGGLGRNSDQVVGAVTARCENDIKDITEALLTDQNVNVRIRLITNILPVCQFFGVDKTNDIILPHLITYLNDPSFQLRLAFLSSIKSIGNFIGVLAFEQYLLPLLIQTLGDHEPFVVLKVLEIFNYFVSERLINPKAQFNALSIYKELLASTLMLLLQPNEWIRQSVIFLILSISDNLSNADKFCFLYPLIKEYLSYDISVISWDHLYPCLTKPLSRQIFELALTWLTKSSGKSLFWKQTGISYFRSNGKRKLVTYSKDMGKSIYLGKATSSGSAVGDKKSITDTLLSHTDRQWILKMKSIGMEEAELWKISALRKYLSGISKSGAYTESGDHRNFELATNVNIPPLNVFCEVTYKTEALTNRQKGTVFSLEQPETRDKVTNESISGSLTLPHGTKAKASLQTNEANIFAEMNSTHEEFDPRSHSHRHHQENQIDVQNTIHKVFCMTNERIISVNMRHNFGGSNPHILEYLKSIDFRPSCDDFAEFGSVVKSNNENEVAASNGISIKGTQVTHIHSNTSFKSIDAITKIALCPSSEFFLSGSETGVLKVWDISKLETVSAKTAVLSLNLGQEITDIVFLPHRFVFAVTTTDGQIRLFRVQVARGKNRRIVKYTKLAMIRILKLDKGFAKTISFAQVDSKEVLVVVSSSCQVVAYDVIKTTKVFELQNPPQYGVPTSFIISKTGSWLLLGTTEGVLCFWDLRFEALLNCWKIASDQVGDQTIEVKKLVSFPFSTKQKSSDDVEYFAMIGGINEQDVTVWEVPSFECRAIFCANQENPKLKKYFLQKLESPNESSIENIFAQFTLDFDQIPSRCNTSLCYVGQRGSGINSKGIIATSTGDNRIIIWNLSDISQSTSLLDSRQATFTKNEMSSKFSISYEKLSANLKQGRFSKESVLHDTITDIAMVTKPYPMIMVGERSGSIRVYK
ncbi:hypothetical protein JCM33374_g6334 [Metschnikowia sp. JCM 33374]|nr:hypothetical protein JCM33374_g6334 [Metschnikowia sp. JCM 33374]